METKAYGVPGMHCDHCKAAVTNELAAVAGVELVEVDLEHKLVTISGHGLDEAALTSAIEEAGYEVTT